MTDTVVRGQTDILGTPEDASGYSEAAINPHEEHITKSGEFADGTLWGMVTDIGGYHHGGVRRLPEGRTANNDAAHIMKIGDVVYGTCMDGVGVEGRGELATVVVMDKLRKISASETPPTAREVLASAFRPFITAERALTEGVIVRMLRDFDDGGDSDNTVDFTRNVSELGFGFMLDEGNRRSIPPRLAKHTEAFLEAIQNITPDDIFAGLRSIRERGEDTDHIDEAAKLLYGLISGDPMRISETVQVDADFSNLDFPENWADNRKLEALEMLLKKSETTASIVRIEGDQYELAYSGDTTVHLLTEEGEMHEITESDRGPIAMKKKHELEASLQDVSLEEFFEQLMGLEDTPLSKDDTEMRKKRELRDLYNSSLYQLYEFGLNAGQYDPEFYIRTAFNQLPEELQTTLFTVVGQGDASIPYHQFRQRIWKMDPQFIDAVFKSMYGNVILDSVGRVWSHDPEKKMHTVTGSIAPGDALLISTDGFLQRLSDDEITTQVDQVRAGTRNAGDALSELSAIAIGRGTSDNLTAELLLKPKSV